MITYFAIVKLLSVFLIYGDKFKIHDSHLYKLSSVPSPDLACPVKLRPNYIRDIIPDKCELCIMMQEREKTSHTEIQVIELSASDICCVQSFQRAHTHTHTTLAKDWKKREISVVILKFINPREKGGVLRYGEGGKGGGKEINICSFMKG